MSTFFDELLESVQQMDEIVKNQHNKQLQPFTSCRSALPRNNLIISEREDRHSSVRIALTVGEKSPTHPTKATSNYSPNYS